MHKSTLPADTFVKVKFSHGVFLPLEKVVLSEGQELIFSTKIIQQDVEVERRQKFLTETDKAFTALRQNAAAWEAEQSERKFWEQTLLDGLNE
jgi:predicted DNA-binding antitoxin AbrB/MazE fold protein